MARKPPLIVLAHPISVELFKKIEQAVVNAGYGDTIKWSESVSPPTNAKQFASEAIYVICNSGMMNSVAVLIFNRCIDALQNGHSARKVFAHEGKAAAIDVIWKKKFVFFRRYNKASDKLAYLETLPWIGPITKYHLAKNFGANYAKPDVHLLRLAKAENTTAQGLCARLAAETGYRAATIDLILWRACADLIIHSRSNQISI